MPRRAKVHNRNAVFLDHYPAGEQNEKLLLRSIRLTRPRSRVATGFRISAQTAPLIVEALRLYARTHTLAPANFRVEKWDWRGVSVEEIVATTSLLLVGRNAFDAAREQYPGSQLTLRQGIGVIAKAPES